MTGRIDLDVPYWENDDVKSAGGLWDNVKKCWFKPASADPDLFERWMPGYSLERTIPPTSHPAKIAAYYMRVLQHQDLDTLASQKLLLDNVTLQDLASGRLATAAKGAEFWKEARKLHEKSPFPLTPKTGSRDTAPRLAGIVVIVGWKFPKFRQALLALPALITEDGAFVAAQHRPPIINPAYFAPQDRKRLPLLGLRENLDEHMVELDWPLDQSWQEVWQATNALFQSVANENTTLHDFRPATTRPPSIWLVPHEHHDESVIHLKALYHQLSNDNSSIPDLYKTICEANSPREPSDPRTLLSIKQQRELAIRHTGHMSSAFGLDLSQREALRHFIATPTGSPLAISGPPGTGKTACLQGIIATMLVNSTLATAESTPRPPLVVACSATNQAVTNIINSFGASADPDGTLTLSSRWLPPIQSYGWYYASQAAAARAEFAQFQILQRHRRETWAYFGSTEGFDEYIKNHEATASLQGTFLRAFRETFPQDDATTLNAAATALLSRLKACAQGVPDPLSDTRPMTLPAAVAAATLLSDLVDSAGLSQRQEARTKLDRKYRRDRRLASRHVEFERETSQLAQHIRELQHLARLVSDGIGGTPRPNWFSRILRSLTRLRTRQRRRHLAALLERFGLSVRIMDDAALLEAAENAIADLQMRHAGANKKLDRFKQRHSRITQAEDLWLPDAQSHAAGLDDMETLVAYFLSLAKTFLSADIAEAWQRGLDAALCGTAPETDFDARQGARLGAAIASRATDAGSTTFAALDELLDRTIRRQCFNLAARYWEARWLIETLTTNVSFRSLEQSLRRHCMLAPVVVSTVNLLPSLFRSETNSAHMDLELADLLIIDEAGQVDPAISVGLFALARRAIVVGDVEQLKPIWSIGHAQDLGLLRQSALQDDTNLIEQRGMRASNGSAMAAAQTSSAFSADDGRGITLLRHYRCRPTIIEFCNRLVYDQLRPLIPVTHEDPDRMFHPMTYVECEHGRASRENGSVVNREEADELIDWLVQNRRRIECHYNPRNSQQLTGEQENQDYRDIGDLIGVVTPFAEHTRYLKTKLLERLRDLDDGKASSIVGRMKLGTVHTLQGAERPLVLFSATNTPDDGGKPFIDSNRDMLNVAVSRAQDTFILFGHPGLFFSPQAQTLSNHLPSAVLGRYMKTYGRRLYPTRLVIVESPGKAAAVQKALGKDCRVEATSGHFREIDQLDANTGRVSWRVDPNREPMLSTFAALLEEAGELVLATDDDREGDAIAWHLIEALRRRCSLDGLVISRMIFHEITDCAVVAAFNHRMIWSNTKRAEAAITRAIVDKAIGEVMSAEVNRRLQLDGSSQWHGVGRVRIALLRLIAEQDENARTAPPEEYIVRLEAGRQGAAATFWLTETDAPDSPTRRFASLKEAEDVVRSLRDTSLALRFQKKGYWLGPATPAGTAEVLIAAYEDCGLSPQDTYRILQDLYEGNESAN